MNGLITVRTSSSRLNKKCLMRFENHQTLVEHIIDRCLIYNINPIICTSTDSSDDIIEEISKQKNVKFFRGSLDNKIKRWAECAKFFNLKTFHSIDADDPFFDGDRMKESMKLLNSQNLDFVKPSYYSDNGGATEGYSISCEFLNNISLKYNEDNLDTEMAIYFFEKHSNNYKIIEDPIYKLTDIIPRMTLDYFEDYVFLNHLAFVVKENFKRKNIENYLRINSVLNNLNNHLNKVWKEKQLSKKI